MNSVSSNYSQSESATGILSGWGRAAEELYNRYHKVNDLLNDSAYPVPDESCRLRLTVLLQRLMDTLITLVEDISVEAPEQEDELMISTQLQTHTSTIQAAIQYADAELNHLYWLYPLLKTQNM